WRGFSSAAQAALHLEGRVRRDGAEETRSFAPEPLAALSSPLSRAAGEGPGEGAASRRTSLSRPRRCHHPPPPRYASSRHHGANEGAILHLLTDLLSSRYG